MNLTIQHAADANRNPGQGALIRPEVAGQMFADRLEKQARLAEQQVVKSPESEEADVKGDRDGHGGGYQGNRGQRKRAPVAAAKEKKRTGESLFDIRV
jgi:hypothetical protein